MIKPPQLEQSYDKVSEGDILPMWQDFENDG